MRKFCWCLSLAVLGVGAMADHVYTNWSWGHWTVTTGEELWCGRRHESYSALNMFDGDLRTAWVYSGIWGEPTSPERGPDGNPIYPKLRAVEDRYWIHIQSSKPLWVDEIRVTNGYCKDSFTYGRNARISRLDIYDDYNPGVGGLQRRVKSVHLSDKMGFHVIKLPARKWDGILLVAKALNAGTDPDVAISELKLFYKGKEVTPRPKEYFLFSPGSDCGCGGGGYLIDRKGTVLAESHSEAGFALESPSGRYFVGLSYGREDIEPGEWRFWVFDSHRKRIIEDRRWKKGAPELVGWSSLVWDNSDHLYNGYENGPRSEWKLLWDPRNGLSRLLR